jgi:sporulation protein YlmC with PRC-barrel domain
MIASERVRGTGVVSADGAHVGKIVDLVINKHTGVVAHAILGEGGVLGLGERYRPIAWSELTYDTERNAYVVPLTQSEVEAIEPLNLDDSSGWMASQSAVFI